MGVDLYTSSTYTPENTVPVALLIDKDEKAKRMEGKLIESLHEFTLDKELV